jgi:hypothetical protein
MQRCYRKSGIDNRGWAQIDSDAMAML